MSSHSTGIPKIPFHLFLLVFLATACLRVTITSLGVFIEEISLDLSLSKTITSLLITVPTLCMGICALLATPLSNRFGLEVTITFSILAIAIGTFFRTFLTDLTALIFFSFIMGTGIAIVGPLASGFVKKHFGKAMAKGMFAYSLGIGCSGILGTFITAIVSQYFQIHWTKALFFWSFPIFIIAFIWLFYLRTLTRQNQTKTIQAPKAKLPWGNRKAWLSILIFGLQSGAFYSIVTWILPYLSSQGISVTEGQVLINVLMVSGLIGSFLYPICLARFRQSLSVYFTCFSLIFAYILMIFLVDVPFFLYLAVALIGFSATGAFLITLILPFAEVDTGEKVAGWTAMMLFGGYVISSIMPTLLGFIYDMTGSYQNIMWGLLIISILLLLSFIIFPLIKSAPNNAEETV